jgi:hypothetical protein
LDFIKDKIGQKAKTQVSKYYEQPEQLNVILDSLARYLSEITAQIQEIRPISYGRQIKVVSGSYWAEINVFFGKKGISIVGTTKTGSHREFCQSVVDFLKLSFQIP